MELSFGRREDGMSYVRVKGKTPADFKGHVRIETPTKSLTRTDTFDVVKRYQVKKDSEGNYYEWYLIENHYQTEERFTPECQESMDTELEDHASKIDYIAMMTDVDIEEV